MAATGIDNYPKGRRLVEVFSVRINNVDGKNLVRVYGVIKATDGLGTQYLYNRDTSNPQSVYPDDDLELTGPPHYISAAGHLRIDLTLYDHDRVAPDDEIIKGEISWSAFDPYNIKYNEVDNVSISGKYGEAMINYIILSNASEAINIQVVLKSGLGDEEKPAHVYGSIKASNGFGEIQ